MTLTLNIPLILLASVIGANGALAYLAAGEHDWFVFGVSIWTALLSLALLLVVAA